MVVVPGIEATSESTQHLQPAPKFLAAIQIRGSTSGNQQRVVVISGTDVPHAAKQALPRARMLIEDFLDPIQRKVSVGDDRRDLRAATPRFGALASGRHHELDFAKRAELFRSALSVRCVAFDEDRLHDVVSTLGIGP
jgi:hypothetical protein